MTLYVDVDVDWKATGKSYGFRGFLLEAIKLEIDSLVIGHHLKRRFGSFIIPPGADYRKACDEEGAITHKDNTDKPSITAQWTSGRTTKQRVQYFFK